MILPTSAHNLHNAFQSAYRPGHSTEAALLKDVNDLFLSLSKGSMSVLDLFNVSSAFDIIDHSILAHRLHTDFGLSDAVLQSFSSYLTDRTQYVSLSNHCITPVHSCVPQGSVLVPMLFTKYIKPLFAIIDHTLSYTIHLLMICNCRCLLHLTKYLSYFTQRDHVYVMSKLGQL